MFPGVPHSLRMREAIEIGWGSRKAPQGTLPFLIDISQCVSRKFFSEGGLVVMPHSLFYDYGSDRVLPALAHMVLQGVPVEVGLQELSHSEVRDLAGDGMFLPNLATVLVAAYLNPHGLWWGPQ
jgi:hypothetical protein